MHHVVPYRSPERRPLPRPPSDGRSGGRIQSVRPSRCHNQPIAHATSRLATNRARTICGLPGNATAVAASTIGLIAGADSRNASAAAGVTPRRTSAPATGTEAHSQPGRTAPAIPATGTAREGRLGSARAKNDGGTNTAMIADSSTPRTRKGNAWTTTATNTVIQLCMTGAANARRIGPCSPTTRTSTMVSTRDELNCQPCAASASRSSPRVEAASVVVTGEVPPVRRGFMAGFASTLSTPDPARLLIPPAGVPCVDDGTGRRVPGQVCAHTAGARSGAGAHDGLTAPADSRGAGANH